MPHTPCIVIEAVIELYRLVPVVHAWGVMETVITCSLSRFLDIWLLLTVIQVKIWSKSLSGTVIEIILRIEAVLRIILLTEILHPLRLADRVILPGYMIRHEIDDYLHA